MQFSLVLGTVISTNSHVESEYIAAGQAQILISVIDLLVGSLEGKYIILYSILFYSVLFYSVLVFCTISYYIILYYIILYYIILYYIILYYII